MATYYFLATLDNDLTTAGNWNDQSDGSGISGTIPGSTDNAVIKADVTAGSIAVNNLDIIDGADVSNTSASLIIYGTLNIGPNSVINSCTFIGPVTSIPGGVTLDNCRLANVNITGDLTVNGGAILSGDDNGTNNVTTSITGNVTINSVGENQSGDVLNIVGDVTISATCSSTLAIDSLTGKLILANGNTASITASPTLGTFYSEYTTLYYNNTGGADDWNTPDGWYVDSGLTQKSLLAPTSSDNVVLRSSPSNGSLLSLSVADAAIETSTFTISNGAVLIASGNITVDGSGYSVGNALSGTANLSATNCYFNNGATFLSGSITVTGACEFNDNSIYADGYVVGTTRFSDTSTFTGGTAQDIEIMNPVSLPFTFGGFYDNVYYKNYPTRTVYFHSLTSTDLGDLLNWFDDSSFTVPAQYLPGGDSSEQKSGQNNVPDSIVIESDLDTVSASNDTMPYFTHFDDVTVNNGLLDIDLDATGTLTVNNSSSIGSSGSETLTVDESAIFNDYSINYGVINAYGIFLNDNSSNSLFGTLNSLGSTDITITYPVVVPVGGTLNPGGSVIYVGYSYYFYDTGMNSNDWNNINNWFFDLGHMIPANNTPTEIYPGDNIILHSSVLTSSGGTPTANDILVPDGYHLDITLEVNNLATFNTGGYLIGTVNGDAIFRDDSYNDNGSISGTATFSLSSASVMISNGYDGTYGDIEYEYGKGVNGSSILGLV